MGRLPYVERDLESRAGAVDLLGLVWAKNVLDWDLLIAAPWLFGDIRPGLDTIVEVLKERIGDTGLMTLARIVPLDDRVPFLTAMRSLPRVEHGMYEMKPGEYGGVDVETGFLLTNRIGKRARRVAAR